LKVKFKDFSTFLLTSITNCAATWYRSHTEVHAVYRILFWNTMVGTHFDNDFAWQRTWLFIISRENFKEIFMFFQLLLKI
jgi:hypothetical protein